MITNNKVTIYHAVKNAQGNKTEWERYNYDEAWVFGGEGAGINKGYDGANNVDVRLPYAKNNNLDITKFKIGDIIVPGELKIDINTQQDLKEYVIFNITSITNSTFGNNPHIHIGGR